MDPSAHARPSTHRAALGPFLLGSCVGAVALVACANHGTHFASMVDVQDAETDASFTSDAPNALPEAAPVGTFDFDAPAEPEAAVVSVPCVSTPNVDGDHDGFTPAEGDCDDCDPNVNPGAYDVPGNGIDEDCNGIADDEPTGCDTGLAIDSTNAMDAAKALDLCRVQAGKSWGVESAAWVFPDGTTASLAFNGCPTGGPPNPNSHGLLNSFGANAPRAGGSMLAISSGMARAGTNDVPSPGSGTSPDGGRMCTMSAPPAGFPTSSPSCPGVAAMAGNIFDGMALELKIKVPTNASALAFDFDFFATEFPTYVCSPDGYDDSFVALIWSGAPGTPADHDVAFDSKGDQVSVNNTFIEACMPQSVQYLTGTVSFPCPLGTSQLQGTGVLEDQGMVNGIERWQGGATGWLATHAPVVPGETITLRFAIWDAGDNINDSTALVDGMGWTLASGHAPPIMPVSGPPSTTRPPR